MVRGGIVSLLLTLILYSILGYVVFAMLIGFFPLLAVIVVAVIAVTAISGVIRHIRTRFNTMDHKRKFDEFGNRRTRATVVEVNEGDRKRDNLE